jgi:hypothetical protein
MLLAVVMYGLPRWRFAAVLLLTAGAAAAPFVIADPRGYIDAQDRAGSIPVTSWQPASPYSVWYPVTPAKEIRIRPVDGDTIVRVRPVPPFVAGVAKQLIVISAFLLAVPLLLRRRRLSPADPLLFLAFVLLLRCVLDPFDNPYYHLPFLIAFLAWESLTLRGAPVLSAAASFAFLLHTGAAETLTAIPAYTTHCVMYLAWTLPLLAFMAVHLYSPELGERLRERFQRALPGFSRARGALATG